MLGFNSGLRCLLTSITAMSQIMYCLVRCSVIGISLAVSRDSSATEPETDLFDTSLPTHSDTALFHGY